MGGERGSEKDSGREASKNLRKEKLKPGKEMKR